ncbi:MAG: hypothetical protein AAFY16_13450 [Cyanobacteria bacterium J06642_3]
MLHQGTQFGATHYVIPFIIELCGEPSVPNRASLLYFWSHAITGYFNIRERPTWGDGKTLYRNGEVDHWAMKHGDFQGLNQIYRKSLKGKDLLYKLLNDGEPSLNKKVLCAKLVGIELTPDDALKEVRRGMGLAKMNFLPHARESLLKAIEMDATVFERVPTPEEGWLLYAKAFAECNPQQAVTAFRRAYLINPAIERQVAPNWCLANLLQEYDF